MKKALLLIIIIFYSIGIIAQNSSNDIIYPLDNKKAIIGCKIVEVREGNLVLYMLNGVAIETRAIAIKNDGKYIDLKEFDIKLKIQPSTNNENLVDVSALSQNNANDTIFTNNWGIIGPCNIQEIQTPNKVLFKIDENDSIMKAIAIIRNNEFIDLKTIAKLPEVQQNIRSIDSLINLKYNDQSYFQYLYRYNKAQKNKRAGKYMTIAGVGITTFGIYTRVTGKGNMETIGTFIAIGGSVIAIIGTPLWISGSIKSKHNNAALENCKNPNISLNMGISENGVGLVFTF